MSKLKKINPNTPMSLKEALGKVYHINDKPHIVTTEFHPVTIEVKRREVRIPNKMARKPKPGHPLKAWRGKK